MTTLQNKTALVTGASRGIGWATAAALAEAGAYVIPGFTMDAPHRKQDRLSPRSKGKADVQMQFRPT